MRKNYDKVLAEVCHWCWAQPGERCRTSGNLPIKPAQSHADRKKRAEWRTDT